ncbi:MAG TPA: alpha-L-fucosidase C-terminal domain-containing protein [Anaerolineae bacterium]|nr:alpha-L-fucosidase C-terminal domain-containing protein [Anaerolineae bacterium]
MRYTQNGKHLYAILLGRPKGNLVTIESLLVDEGTTLHLLGQDQALEWRQEGEDLRITLPKELPDSPAHTLRLTPPKEI